MDIVNWLMLLLPFDGQPGRASCEALGGRSYSSKRQYFIEKLRTKASEGFHEIDGNAVTHAMALRGKGANVVVGHVCNDLGAWGAGFTASLNALPFAKVAYKSFHSDAGSLEEGGAKALPDHQVYNDGCWALRPKQFERGAVQFAYGDGLTVANMIAQAGLPSKDNPKPIDMVALERCLDQLGRYTEKLMSKGELTVLVMPRIGSGLAGGSWSSIRCLINQVVCHRYRVPVLIYKPASKPAAKRRGTYSK